MDYCPAAAIQRKVKGKERDTGLITRMRLAAVQPRQKSRMASILETVSIIAEFGQQQ
jgi:hypothetical protein